MTAGSELAALLMERRRRSAAGDDDDGPPPPLCDASSPPLKDDLANRPRNSGELSIYYGVNVLFLIFTDSPHFVDPSFFSPSKQKLRISPSLRK